MAFFIAVAVVLIAAIVLVKSEVSAVGKIFSTLLIMVGIILAARISCDAEAKEEKGANAKAPD